MRVYISVKNYKNQDFTYALASSAHWTCVLFPFTIPTPQEKFSYMYIVTNIMLTYALFRYAEVVIGIVCGCMPVLPKFFGHVIPTFGQTLSYHYSKARDFLGRALSRPSSSSTSCGESSTWLPQESGDDPAVTRGAKKFLIFRSFGNDGKGLSTIIHANLPRTVNSTSTLRQDLGSQQRITKTTQVTTSTSDRTDSQEKGIFDP